MKGASVREAVGYRRVILLSSHYFESRRRAGFHWLADTLWRAGWDVTFATVGLSLISRLRSDPRMAYPVLAEANRIKRVRERLASFVLYTPFHPVDLRRDRLNRLAAPLFARYGRADLGALAETAREADLMIFESGVGLLLFDALRALNPRARTVYRVSDDVRVIRNHAVVRAREDRVVAAFDRVSVPSPYLHRRFASLPNAHVDPHGLAKDVYDAATPDPFAGRPGVLRALSVGSTLFDPGLIDAAARLRPTWTFHVVGGVERSSRRPNVRYHGELPYNEVVPFVKHADVGLAPYLRRDGAAYLAHTSNKMIQYTYCRLPIVAPDFVADGAPAHVFGYEADDDASIDRALGRAAAFDRGSIDPSVVPTWEEVTARILGGVGLG